MDDKREKKRQNEQTIYIQLYIHVYNLVLIPSLRLICVHLFDCFRSSVLFIVQCNRNRLLLMKCNAFRFPRKCISLIGIPIWIVRENGRSTKWIGYRSIFFITIDHTKTNSNGFSPMWMSVADKMQSSFRWNYRNEEMPILWPFLWSNHWQTRDPNHHKINERTKFCVLVCNFQWLIVWSVRTIHCVQVNSHWVKSHMCVIV